MKQNIIQFKSYFGGFLFDINIKDFYQFLNKDIFLLQLWKNEIGYTKNMKYYLDKQRMGYSEEKEKIKLYKIINGKLRLPKGHFYLVGATFLSLLAEKFNLSFVLQKKENHKIKGFNFVKDFKLYPHQEKILDVIVNKRIKQIDLIVKYFSKIINDSIYYAGLNTNTIKEITIKYFPFLQDDIYAGYVISPARSGKTITMLALAQKLNLRTLIIVDKELIFKQFKERIKQFTNLDIERECRFYQGFKSFGKFTDDIQIGVGLIQTISNLFNELDKKKKDIIQNELAQYDLVLVDEAHAVATETFMTALSGLTYEKVFGFTATRMRGDGNHKLLDYYVGETIIKINQNEVGNMVYDIHIYPLIYKTNQRLGFIKVKRTKSGVVEYLDKWAIKKLYNDNTRNNLIVNKILSAIKQDRLIIAIGETLDHLDYIAQLLNQKFREETGKDIKIAYVINSKISKKEKERILQLFEKAGKDRSEGKEFYPKVLLATASLLGKGFDGPYFDTLFLMAPIGAKKKNSGEDGRALLVQVVNRIGNKVPGKKQPICVDIIDIEPENVLLNMAKARYFNVYKDRFKDLKNNFVPKGKRKEILNNQN